MTENKQDLENIITEDELIELFGLRKQAIASLRYNEGLPYIKVNTRSRLYYVPDLMEWMLSRRTQSQT